MTTAVAEQLVITEPGIYDLDEALYHGDPVPGGSLSYSGAKRLLATCPAKFHYERKHGRPPKREFDFGHAAHRKILGRGNDVVVAPYDAWRTNDSKAIRAKAYAEGKVPILEAEEKTVDEMEAAVRLHPIAGPLLAAGVPEQSLFWIDERTGLWLRSRPDWMRVDGPRRPALVDYKTCDNADDEACAKAIHNLGYHQQADWYSTGAVANGVDPEVAFVFVFQEKLAPYLVNVVACDGLMLGYGRAQNEKARDLFAACTAAGHWPGYGETEITYASLPTWVERRFLEDQ